MKHRFSARVVAVVMGVAISLSLGGLALASSFEWITDFVAATSGEDIAHPGTEIKVYRNVNTSGPYLEYRSAYHQYSTTTPSESGWIEWTECRASSTVSGTVRDGCFPVVTTSTAPMVTSTLWMRVTTNYGGCGEYTPTPDIGSCGDATTTSVLYTP